MDRYMVCAGFINRVVNMSIQHEWSQQETIDMIKAKQRALMSEMALNDMILRYLEDGNEGE